MNPVALAKRFFRLLGFHVHTWGKWTDEGEISIAGRIVGRTQTRKCDACSKLDVHKVWLV